MSKARGKKPQPAVSAPAPAPRPGLADRLFSGRILFLLLALAVLIFYAKPLFDDNASIQWDAVDVHYSAQKYFADETHGGRLPFWTPYVFSGMPFLADPQVGAWYPLNWPFFTMGITPRSIEWELALHCLLALVGGYLLGRELFASRAAAIFAGVFYAFAGFFTGNSSHVAGFQVASLLPWLLWGARRAIGSARRLPALAAVAGLVVLAGHFQMALYAFSALGLFVAADWLPRRGSPKRQLTVLACAAVAAVALSAVMVLPGLELTGQSERAVTTFAQSDYGFLVPGALLTLVSPNHYGAPDLQGYSGPSDITQFYFYQGILLLPLVVWGIIAARRQWRVLLAPALLVIFAVWYGFGRSWGLYGLTALFPGFKSIRAPVNVWFVATMGLALLAASGIEALRARFKTPWIAVALLVLTAGDLYYWNMDRNGLAYARESFQEIYGAAEDRFQKVTQSATNLQTHRLYAADDSTAFGPLNGVLEMRVQATWGYNPLELLRYRTYLETTKSNPRLLDALAVTAEFAQNGFFAPNPGALPRFYAPDTATPARSREEATQRLASLDSAHETVVEGLAAPMPANSGGKFSYEAYDGVSYRVRCEAQKATLWRIAVPYFPGWQAEVDGKPADVMPADLALMAIVVPAGTHEVTLQYRSTRFALGAGISLVGWATVLGAWLWMRRRGVAAA
ncbi:MAG TPA: YfhO family protein [Verrucomicrobiae bacterium]|nr:YfhO family protein [Verrucomicrobiae bacterium]